MINTTTTNTTTTSTTNDVITFVLYFDFELGMLFTRLQVG